MKLYGGSRQSKMVGNFGKQLVCNWLTRLGWEAVPVDYTGIDLIAYHRESKKRIGIAVKARIRAPGTEKAAVHIFKKKKDDRENTLRACKEFNCEASVAVICGGSQVGRSVPYKYTQLR